MGLLTMLSRRLRRKKSKNDLLQSQQVTPVQTPEPAPGRTSGMRTTPLHHEARFSQVSLNQSDGIYATKQPPNPAFRGGFDYDRPGSVQSFHSLPSFHSENSDRPRILQRPKREARRPPVSFRKPSSLSLAQTNLAQQHPPQLGQSAMDARSSSEGRERAGSMNSLSRRQSRDLLEAVEEIRPLNFRSRVQAAGARDYGEDVADRNIRLSMSQSSPDLQSRFTSDGFRLTQPGRVNSRTKSIESLSEQYRPTARKTPSQASFDPPDLFTRRNKNRLSLNTYKPSGLVSTGLSTPRSAVTTPSYRGGRTPGDFDSSDAEPDAWSRQYHMSPSGSNFSIPRSPMTIRHPIQEYDQQPQYIKEDNFLEEREFGDIIPSNHSSQQKPAASDGQVSVESAARFSHGTCRSSLASSVTSRNPSMDFTPLGYPRSQGIPKTSSNRVSDIHDVPTDRSQSLRSHRHTRSNSSGDSYNHSHRHTHSNNSVDSCSHQRTKSLLTTPSGLEDLAEVDGQTVRPPSSIARDWALVTPSNGSTSSSSNGLYSGASSSMRPASRHTKATSIDSTPRPPSSQSCVSASAGRSASGWSPSTTQSTGFNIDDYISSDDDSFTAEKRPSAQGEEELLFKGSYGVTGAALPGLLESMMDACPPPVVRLRATQLTSPPKLLEEAEGETEDDNDAAGAPDIDDGRRSQHRDLHLRHVRGNPEDDRVRTFGRKSGRPQARSTKQPTPSWLPSDDWAPSAKAKRSAASLRSGTSSSNNNNQNNKVMHEGMHLSSRGQERLSALGTPHGRSLLTAAAVSEGAKRGVSSKREPGTSPIMEEVETAVAVRLRKVAKARQREDQAKSIHEKRMTRAFGGLDTNMLAALKAQQEGVEGGSREEQRGRTRVRGAMGQSVVVG